MTMIWYICELGSTITLLLKQGLCVPSVCTWSRSLSPHLTHGSRLLRAPSACTWYRSWKHHPLLTVSASSCAISMYEVSFFEVSTLAHGFGLFACHQYVRGAVSLKHHPLLMVLVSSRVIQRVRDEYIFEASSLAYDFGLSTVHYPESPWCRSLKPHLPLHDFQPLHQISECMWCRFLKLPTKLKRHGLLRVPSGSA